MVENRRHALVIRLLDVETMLKQTHADSVVVHIGIRYASYIPIASKHFVILFSIPYSAQDNLRFMVDH